MYVSQLKASLNPPLTPLKAGDSYIDGHSTNVETALGTSPIEENPPTAASQAERGEDGRLKITFTRVYEDFTYVIEACNDLGESTVIATKPGTVGKSVTVVDTDVTD